MMPCSVLSGTRRFGGTSGTTQRTTRRHIPEEDTLRANLVYLKNECIQRTIQTIVFQHIFQTKMKVLR
jgi:hypothetical protein